MSSPDGEEDANHPAGLRDDVTRQVVEVELDKDVAGLGFCIEGGKQSLTGDRPIAVKRIFRCMYRWHIYLVPLLSRDLQFGLSVVFMRYLSK